MYGLRHDPPTTEGMTGNTPVGDGEVRRAYIAHTSNDDNDEALEASARFDAWLEQHDERLRESTLWDAARTLEEELPPLKDNNPITRVFGLTGRMTTASWPFKPIVTTYKDVRPGDAYTVLTDGWSEIRTRPTTDVDDDTPVVILDRPARNWPTANVIHIIEGLHENRPISNVNAWRGPHGDYFAHHEGGLIYLDRHEDTINEWTPLVAVSATVLRELISTLKKVQLDDIGMCAFARAWDALNESA